jgi:hypothetical protein
MAKKPGQAESGQRERDREADQHHQHQPSNMKGAKFSICIFCVLKSGGSGCERQRAGLTAPAFVAGVEFEVAAEHGHALDHLGQALQKHQAEADRQQQHRGPADQAAGVARHLAGQVHLHEQRPAQVASRPITGSRNTTSPTGRPHRALAAQLAVQDVDARAR